MELKLDPDGSLTAERVLAAMGGMQQVAGAIEPVEAPWAVQARACRTEAFTDLKRLSPLLSRLAAAAHADPLR